MRLSMLFQAVVLISVFSGVYNVANKYEAIDKTVHQLDADSEREHENLRVLQAEWAFLTSPVRMEKIARDYLHLDTFDGRQMVAVNNIPMRATMDAQDDTVQLAKAAPETKSAPQTNSAESRVVTASASLPAPIALPPMVATNISVTRGQQ